MNRKDIIFHTVILNNEQIDLLFRLKLPENYYLAGGTALALYLGHRTSLDFDFFTTAEFERNEVLNLLKKEFSEKKITVSSLEKNNFIGKINNVNISVFYYAYKLLDDVVDLRNIRLASLNDIASMKLVAVIQRPKKRDYIDMLYLLKEFSLKKIFDYCQEKYPNFNPYLALRALSYFGDVDDEKIEERGIKILDKSFSWEKTKKELIKKVKDYQLSMFNLDEKKNR